MSLSFKHLTLISILGAVLGLALMALRVSNTLDFDQALQLITSGAEWESMYPIWKVINGQVLYTDRLKIPYNAVVYNWLFYQSYAAFTGSILNFFSLGDEWLPTVGRHFTLIGIATGIVAAFTIFLRLFETKKGWTKTFCLAFATYIATGPLIGWWTFTIRADIWALTFEMIAIACFLKYYPSRRIKAVLLLAAFCYLAWSFKQINVYAVGGAGLFLLLRRDLPALATLIGAIVSLWGATLVLGGGQYIENILFTDFTIIFSIGHGIFTLTNLAIKTLPSLVILVALLGASIISPDSRRILLRDDTVLLAVCGLFVASLLAIPASFQTGAAENYYFTLSFFMGLAAVAGIAVLTRENASSLGPIRMVSAVGWGAFVVVICSVFVGYKGVTDVRSQHIERMAHKRCLDNLPKPFFANYPYYGLPWMTPGNEPFVFSFQYLKERQAGKNFEKGGLGGLITSGRFKALALVQRPPPKTFDGASFEDFVYRPDLCAEMSILLRKSD